MQRAVRLLLILLLILIAAPAIFVCWSGYRVTSAINYGALRAKLAVCLDTRHISHIERGYVPQRIVNNVVAQQISAHYYNNPKRRLPRQFLLASSAIGWSTFWSADDRRSIYNDLERRMPPCPKAVQRYREMYASKARARRTRR